MAPYELSYADTSGTETLHLANDDLDHLLSLRDFKRDHSDHRSIYWRVTDADDAERGEAEWCENCGVRGAFGDECASCREGEH